MTANVTVGTSEKAKADSLVGLTGETNQIHLRTQSKIAAEGCYSDGQIADLPVRLMQQTTVVLAC